MKCTISKDGKSLVISLPLNKTAVLSSSEKTCTVATTRGFVDAGLAFGDYGCRVSVNATISKDAKGAQLVPDE